MRKVIVTGGAGFIGSHTCVELAAAGLEPVIVDDLRNSRERALEGIAAIIGRMPAVHRIDCTDSDALHRVFRAEGPIAGVVHFAADKAVGESVQQPLRYYRNNIGSLIALLEVMQRHDVGRIVFSSSCTVYGQPDRLPVTEDAPDRNAGSPYGFTKVAGEQLLRDHVAATPGLRTVLLRYFNPIGAHPSARIGELPIGVPNNLIPFVTQTAAGLRERITVFGDDYDTPDGSCVRDYIHVVDLARAHVRAFSWMDERSAPACAVFNIGTGRGHSVLEVLRSFEQVNDLRLPVVIGPRRDGDVEQVYADTTRSRTVLGWEPRLTLADALRDAWRWQQALGTGAR
ncbi:MAG: UDP-glucose 4-epimerase GalE [Flavobacteriales bacterium]|jgi:UDP-glucose 4-epimerase|nr:UDP-glucose 4-epimerase GalE [Flavobacteriales bacterium]